MSTTKYGAWDYVTLCDECGSTKTECQCAKRIAALERDRALLLAYIQTRQHMIRGWTDEVSDDEFGRRSRATDEAWNALRDAGLLEGDDDENV